MSDPRQLLDMAEWFDSKGMETEADICLNIADRYAQLADENTRLRDDNEALDAWVQRLLNDTSRQGACSLGWPV